MRTFFFLVCLVAFRLNAQNPPTISAPASSYHDQYHVQTRFQAFQHIENDYMQNIEPIFKRACYDCHTNLTQYPWFYETPILKQWIDHQIYEGQKSLTLLNHFPFIGPTSPKEDLLRIGRALQRGDMPPFSYRLFIPKGRITEKESEQVHLWVTKSLKLLETVPPITSQKKTEKSRS